jgi:predicted regulator of Ras-like GTPase activity (Roadblock/LC7/MglB family)
MSNPLTQPIDNILRKIPGVIGVVLTDADGTPVYANGRFDCPLLEFCAWCAVSHQGCVAVGKPLNQTLSSIIIEFNKLKIYHVSIAEKGQLIILTKIQESQFGMLKIAVQNAIEALFEMFGSQNQSNPVQENLPIE